MKRLISQEEVLNNKNEKEIYIDDNTIITAAAKDLAKEFGIEFKKCDCKSQKNDIEEKKKEVKQSQDCKKSSAVLSEDQIYKILKKGIEQGLLSESDIERMIG
ncbi:hypothetical protein [Anaerococcus hydrogenalis]|uniref:Conserved domain protein n=1 Tax=Anaerococcus hydrogenalis ACS-025-V-Sch4 TaxID=879306 RepID=F0H1F1_9FIRM|nr:hypothetical protein [Anaerococcus hydrogenalis]EGC83705.1 conserved domain protein [Anaerococcus hydrogenalis ACS-025-V-Sch4]